MLLHAHHMKVYLFLRFSSHWSTTTYKLDETALLMGRLQYPHLICFCLMFLSSHFSSIFIYLCYRSGFGLPGLVSFWFPLFHFSEPAANDCLHGNYPRSFLFLLFSLLMHKWNDSAAFLQINFIVTGFKIFCLLINLSPSKDEQKVPEDNAGVLSPKWQINTMIKNSKKIFQAL